MKHLIVLILMISFSGANAWEKSRDIYGNERNDMFGRATQYDKTRQTFKARDNMINQNMNDYRTGRTTRQGIVHCTQGQHGPNCMTY